MSAIARVCFLIADFGDKYLLFSERYFETELMFVRLMDGGRYVHCRVGIQAVK
jgi:hypothetical protein